MNLDVVGRARNALDQLHGLVTGHATGGENLNLSPLTLGHCSILLLESELNPMLKPVVATGSSDLEKEIVAVARSPGIQIGELSKRTGCNIETIRYYERICLLPAPPRSAGRYRIYDNADVRRLALIRRARELGFTLDQVRALLALSANHGQGACAEVRDLAARHLAEVRAKITDLRAMERVLADAVRRCAAGELPGCPIIGALSAA